MLYRHLLSTFLRNGNKTNIKTGGFRTLKKEKIIFSIKQRKFKYLSHNERAKLSSTPEYARKDQRRIIWLSNLRDPLQWTQLFIFEQHRQNLYTSSKDDTRENTWERNIKEKRTTKLSILKFCRDSQKYIKSYFIKL